MATFLGEELIDLNEAAAEVARLRPGRPPHTATLWKWIHRGVAGVRLEGARRGGRWYTSAEAIARFMDRLSEPAGAA